MTEQATLEGMPAAPSASPVPDWAIELAASAWQAPQTSATPKDPVLCAVFAGILAKLSARYQAEVDKHLRVAIGYSDIIAGQIIAMQAAVIAHMTEGPDYSIQWISNTLAGPGMLPNTDEVASTPNPDAKAPAQAWFDAKMAEHEAFRAAHPVPGAAS